MNPHQQAAHDYAKRGWRVIPIKAGEKRPPMHEWQNHATTNATVIDEWWGRKYQGCGVGIATGEVSGLWVLDIDGQVGADSLADLEATYGKLPDTVEVVTGSGGRHLYFAWPTDGTEVRNDQASKLGRGVDVRGEGGQVLAPETIHPNGTPYVWEASSHPDDVELAQAPEWLLKLLRSTPAPQEARRERAPRPDGDLPGDRFAASVDWPAMLTADGATYLGTRKHHADGTTYELWARPPMPGEDTYEPHTSATLYYKGSDVLKVFTGNWQGVDKRTGEVWRLEQDATYTRFGYYAARHHGGDHSAAAAAIRAREDDAELESWVAEAATSTETPVERPWEPPEPLAAPITAGPTFPTEALPEWIADMVERCADVFQVEPDLPASIAIGTLSAMCFGHLKVRLGQTDWCEPTNLYIVTALPPGGGKSPVLKKLTGCLREFQAEREAQTLKMRREAEYGRQLLEKRKKGLEAQADKADDSLALVDEMMRLDDQIDAIEIPPSAELLSDDSTPEALTNCLQERGGRTVVMSTEASLFDQMGGMYKERGKPANLSVYLQAWSGDPMVVDRKDRKVRLDEPLLVVCITAQPSLIANLGTNGEMVGRGALARFMYAVPESRVGHRDRYKVLEVIPPEVIERYDESMLTIGRRCASWQTPAELQLGQEAQDIFLAWDQDLEDRLRRSGDLRLMPEWVSKLRATMLRLVGLLHFADGSDIHDPVSVETLDRALLIGDYWIAHAAVVHRMWSDRVEGQSDAAALLEWLAKSGTETFTARDVRRAQVGNLSDMKDIETALKLAVDKSWIRSSVPGAVVASGRGRPSPILTTHPELSRYVAESHAP